MARTISSKEIPSVKVEVQNRTWRVEMFTDLGSDYLVRFHREQIKLLDDEKSGDSKPLGVVQAKLSKVANRAITVGEMTLTVQQIAAFIAQFADDLEADQEVSPPQ